MKNFMIETKIKVAVTADMVANALCGAFEMGAIAYWAGCDMNKAIEPEVIDFDQFKDGSGSDLGFDNPAHIYTHVHWVMSPGGFLCLYDVESDRRTREHWMLGLPQIERGLQLMAEKYPSHFNDLVSENDDATTHDVLVQCAVLGDVVYG